MEEQLPDAAAGQPPQLVIDALAPQGRDGGGQVLGRERHVVEDAAPVMRQILAVDHMQDRGVVIGIEPPSRKLEWRPPTHPEAEQIAIETPCGLEVVAQHSEMVHCRYGHRESPLGPLIGKRPTRVGAAASIGSAAKAAAALLEGAYRAQEIDLAEGGPQDVGKIEFAMGALP